MAASDEVFAFKSAIERIELKPTSHRYQIDSFTEQCRGYGNSGETLMLKTKNTSFPDVFFVNW